MAVPSLKHHGNLLANLKVNFPGKPLAQQCQDLVKIIADSHVKELHAIFSWLTENIFGSLDGVLGGWNLRLLHSRCADFAPVLDFLKPSGSMMKLVYTLQEEEYKYEVPVNHLPAPVKTAIQEGVLPDCPLFRSLHFPMTNVLTLNPFEFYIFYFTSCIIPPKSFPAGQHGSTTDNVYFVLVDMYLKYFLPTQESVPPSPFPDHRGSVRAASPRSSNMSLLGHGFHSPSLLKHHIDFAAKEIWRSETLLHMFVEVWLNHYSLKLYQKLQSPQVKLALLQYHLSMSSIPCQSYIPSGSGTLHTYQEAFSPSEEHVLAVRLLVKHLHAFANSLKPKQPTPSPTRVHLSPLDDFKRIVLQHFVQQKLFLFLHHCFGHWPLDASFRAVLETWLSFIQPWRYAGDKTAADNGGGGRIDPERWEVFVQENLLVYTKLFQVFLNRVGRMNLVNGKNALMLFRVAKVFSQDHLLDLIYKAEQLFLEPELVLHQQHPRRYLTPGQGGSFLSSRQHAATDAVFRVKSHVYALEGKHCQYKQMFGSELRSAVVVLVQMVLQARHTAKRIYDRSSQTAASKSVLWWWSAPSSDGADALCGVEPDDNGECLRKTHELLEGALENLCAVFKVNQSQLMQLMANVRSCEDDGESKRPPDCVRGECGLVLTDLGRMQIINEMRKFDIQYQGDPVLQPIRTYENASLVRFLYRMSSLLNAKFEGPMSELCLRTDLVGRLARHYLTEGDPDAVLARCPASPDLWARKRRVGINLRPLASYSTLLLLGLGYLVCGFLGLVAIMPLILLAVFLYRVAPKWKTC
ncbi:sphingomyelin phosphodiesterase 4 isoform X2 [Festucalex cinctus]